MINTLWPYVIGFLIFPAILGIYSLISNYAKLFGRVAHLEWGLNFEKERFDRLDKQVHDHIYKYHPVAPLRDNERV